MSSWLQKETTNRKYKTNLHSWPIIQVLNEYQKFSCPNCAEYIFGRLTHIWFIDINGQVIDFMYHTNHKKNLNEFEKLQVQMINDEALYEVKIDDVWKLKLGKKIIGEEIAL